MANGSPTGSPKKSIVEQFRSLSRSQRNAFFASFLGWALDSLDFFLLILCIPAIAAEFKVKVPEVALASVLTLAFRPVGALIFGWLADKIGRKRTLMINIIAYSAIELACAFAPSLHVLLILRALFGVAMAGFGAWVRRWLLNRCRRKGAGHFQGSCRRAMRLGICWLRRLLERSFIGFRGWDGVGSS